MRDPVCEGAKELVLGTAQLGMAYGATNQVGKPDLADALGLLAFAQQQGIRSVDTARAYGTSEDVIGKYQSQLKPNRKFNVLTKLDPDISNKTSAADIIKATERSLDQSRHALGSTYMPCVMLHRPDQMLGKNTIVIDVLKEQQHDGQIGQIGVSVSEPSELIAVLQFPEVTHVQFPFNFLDHRFENPNVIAVLQERSEVTVHVRSVFLQGILVGQQATIRYDRLGPEGLAMREFLQTLSHLTNGTSPVVTALSYVKSMNWIDGIVVGTGARSELAQISAAYAAPTNPDIVHIIRSNRPTLSSRSLNPANWPKDLT